METLRIGVVGAGYMGRIRAQSAQAHPGCRVVQVVDQVSERAEALANKVGCEAGTDWERLVARRDIDAVVVATPHKHLAPITIAALQAGKHVFCEKPMARTVAEADEVLKCHRSNPQVLVVGFTLRHHPAIARARELLLEGAIGEPFYVRGCYGHGGRPGYEREWRADPELAGGGELLDQGIHLIDLSRWFLGEFRETAGFTATYFWGAGKRGDDLRPGGQAPLEDNAFALLRTADGRVASLHASWTQWKNVFRFEVFGRDGLLAIDGLGGSYGPERLVIGRRPVIGKPPDTEELTFAEPGPGPADGAATPRGAMPAMREPGLGSGVWAREWAALVASIQVPEPAAWTVARDQHWTGIEQGIGSLPSAGSLDARQALRIVGALYASSQPELSTSSDQA